MSSDDSGFDKEAEREKLREKFERDRRDRENTQRMSELLLQGATMTGKHCDRCGDPIFRYDGQEFCPTCQHEAANGEAAEESDGRSSDSADDRPSGEAPADSAEPTDRPDAAGDEREADERGDGAATDADRPDAGDEPRVEINDVRVADRHVDASNLRRPPSRAAGDRHSSEESRRRARDPGEASRDRAPDSPDRAHGADERARGENARDEPDAGDVATARAALVRKLTDLARRAEATDDVARTRELLAATREAAEALEALDRANR